MDSFEAEKIKEICEKIGYGRVMQIASETWKEKDPIGALTIGPCNITLKNKPKIVCLCGSTKFKQEFIKANFNYTMKGYIVLTVGWFSHTDKDIYYPTEEEKKNLDELHLRKIDLADEIFVINVNKYIGESTKNEIEYALKKDKPIIWLEDHLK